MADEFDDGLDFAYIPKTKRDALPPSTTKSLTVYEEERNAQLNAIVAEAEKVEKKRRLEEKAAEEAKLSAEMEKETDPEILAQRELDHMNVNNFYYNKNKPSEGDRKPREYSANDRDRRNTNNSHYSNNNNNNNNNNNRNGANTSNNKNDEKYKNYRKNMYVMRNALQEVDAATKQSMLVNVSGDSHGHHNNSGGSAVGSTREYKSTNRYNNHNNNFNNHHHYNNGEGRRPFNAQHQQQQNFEHNGNPNRNGQGNDSGFRTSERRPYNDNQTSNTDLKRRRGDAS